MTRISYRLVRSGISLLVSAVALSVLSTVVSQADQYESFAFSGYSPTASSTSFNIDQFGTSFFSSPGPGNTLLDADTTYTGSNGDILFHSYAAGTYKSPFASGNYVYGTVNNAYYPGSTDTNTPYGYDVTSITASWTKKTFVSPLSLTDPTAVFHWHVAGTASTNLGVVGPRLDFAVVNGGVTDAGDVFNPSIAGNRLETLSTGDYMYNTGVSIGTPLDFLFWSAAYWNVNPGDLATLGNSTANLTGTANFYDTFEALSIDLYNGDGSLVTDWSLLDSSGHVIYNQNGPVAPSSVPEPGMLTLAGAGLMVSVGLLRRRRSR